MLSLSSVMLVIFLPFSHSAEGSGEPELCPAGTFSPVMGLTNEAGCQPCTAGSYCGEAGLSTPTGPCSQGQSDGCFMTPSGSRFFYIFNRICV